MRMISFWDELFL